MADTKTQEPAPAAVPTQDAAPTLPADAPIDATPVPPAAVSEPTKVTETPLAPAVAVVPVAVPEVTSAPAKVEAPEPQNSLTEKFTEAEWKALKELRVCSRRLLLLFLAFCTMANSNSSSMFLVYSHITLQSELADILSEVHKDKDRISASSDCKVICQYTRNILLELEFAVVQKARNNSKFDVNIP